MEVRFSPRVSGVFFWQKLPTSLNLCYAMAIMHQKLLELIQTTKLWIEDHPEIQQVHVSIPVQRAAIKPLKVAPPVSKPAAPFYPAPPPPKVIEKVAVTPSPVKRNEPSSPPSTPSQKTEGKIPLPSYQGWVLESHLSKDLIDINPSVEKLKSGLPTAVAPSKHRQAFFCLHTDEMGPHQVFVAKMIDAMNTYVLPCGLLQPKELEKVTPAHTILFVSDKSKPLCPQEGYLELIFLDPLDQLSQDPLAKKRLWEKMMSLKKP